MIDDTYALAIYTSRGASSKQKQCGFLCLFVCLFVWPLVCLCVLLFSFVCFLVSLFYDDRWYLCISNLYIAGSVVKTETMWVSLFVRLFICVVTCLFVCLTFSFVCFLVSLFYDDRWYLCISNLYIAGSVVKTKTMWVSLFVRLFICVVTCLFVCLTFFLCLFF